jgi:hypothetical protein
MLFRETVAVCCENHTEYINTLCRQIAGYSNVKADGPTSSSPLVLIALVIFGEGWNLLLFIVLTKGFLSERTHAACLTLILWMEHKQIRRS